MYAKPAHQQSEKIAAAISLETLGMYTEAEGSQHYPAGFAWFFPSKGDFVGFMGNLSSLVRDAMGYFRKTRQFPSEGVAAVDRRESGSRITGRSGRKVSGDHDFGYRSVSEYELSPDDTQTGNLEL